MLLWGFFSTVPASSIGYELNGSGELLVNDQNDQHTPNNFEAALEEQWV